MSTGTVYIVDDDFAVRDSLAMLCEAEGYRVKSYSSAKEFLEDVDFERAGCIVLDVRMDEMSGFQLHAELNRRGSHLPIIYLTAQGDIPMAVRAIKEGALDFLAKPVNDNLLLDRIKIALQQDRELIGYQEQQAERCQWLDLLTPREHTVMSLAIAGQTNKEIGRQLGISYRTVELHRSRILRKANANNLLELAQLLSECGYKTEAA